MSVNITKQDPNSVSLTNAGANSVSLQNQTANSVTVSRFAVGSGDAHYTHTQNTASDQWDVTHSLNKHPAVSVVDSNGYEVIGEVHYMSANRVILEFVQPFSGKAYFN